MKFVDDDDDDDDEVHCTVNILNQIKLHLHSGPEKMNKVSSNCIICFLQTFLLSRRS